MNVLGEELLHNNLNHRIPNYDEWTEKQQLKEHLSKINISSSPRAQRIKNPGRSEVSA